MEGDELTNYWASTIVSIYAIDTHLDFEDIDNPLKFDIAYVRKLTFDPSTTTIAKAIVLKKNVFYDNIDRLDLFDNEI